MMKIVEQIAYILILCAAAAYLWLPGVAPWLMAVGALGIMASHLHQKYGQGSLRQRRNRKLRHMLGLVYMVTAYMMWKHDMQWVAFLLVAVVIELYTLLVSNREDGKS